MPAIALAIQYGADCCDFSSALARDLGCEAFDYRPMELSIAAALEQRATRFGSWLLRPSPPRLRAARAATAAVRGMHAKCHDMLRRSDVLIVGWSAVLALPPDTPATRILVHASREVRLERMAKQHGCPESELEPRFARTEQRLAAYLHLLHGKDLTVAQGFDLAIDSGRRGLPACRVLIEAWLGSADLVGRDSRPRSLADSGAPTHAMGGAGRTYALLGGERVDLTGIASNEAAIAAIEQHLHHECHHRHS